MRSSSFALGSLRRLPRGSPYPTPPRRSGAFLGAIGPGLCRVRTSENTSSTTFVNKGQKKALSSHLPGRIFNSRHPQHVGSKRRYPAEGGTERPDVGCALTAIRSWPWWPADSSVCAVGARVAWVEWWRGYRGCTA